MPEEEGLKKGFNCNKCKEVDNNRMVQCDDCDKWYHYECASVSSDVGNVSWSCGGCNSINNETAGGSKAVPPATSSSGTTVQMQPQAASSPANTGGSQNAKQNATTAPGTLSFPFDVNRRTTVPIQRNEHSTSQLDLQLKMLEEQQRLQQEFLERKYQILSQYGQNEQTQHNLCNTTGSWNFFSGPTQVQLAARQSIPRELPYFSGDPEEWPLFISTFENSTSVAGYSHAENLIRLQACLKGRAKELVKNKLMLPTMVPEIIHTLKMCFGHPEHILERVIEKARRFPPPKDKLEAMIDFALCVKNIYSTMEVCKMEAHMNNPMLVKELVDKLSSQYKLNWAMYPKNDNVPIVRIFSEWIFQIADAASTVVSTLPTGKNALMNTHTEQRPPFELKCCVCECGHKVSDCSDFKNLPLERKWEVVKKNNLCRNCLKKHKGKCYINKECGINECKAKHNKLLHKSVSSVPGSSLAQNNATTNTSEVINSHSTEQYSSSLFRILPIRLHKKNGFIDTYAFLDEGSSVTLIENDIFKQLDIEGVSEPLCLKWTGDTTRQENSSVKASIDISNIFNGEKFTLKCVQTADGLDLPKQSLNMEELVEKYPYLSGIPIKSYANVTPTILIGVDNWRVAVPLKVREGAWKQPIATRTRLGWAIQGCSGHLRQNTYLNIHNCECEKKYNDLHQMVKDHFSLEEASTKSIISMEDTKAMEVLRTTCQKVEGRYEVGLLWKNELCKLPDSYNNAYNRFMCLKRKFEKDQTLRTLLQNQIDNLLAKGYAKKLNAEEIKMSSDRVWYLPIFIVKNPNKPGKIRMVWDAAAKSNGVCLNDFINSGPDLLKSLVNVLLGFRVGKVAVCGDIAEMFHQINVRESDMHSQRFLWWDKSDQPDRPSTYVMRALTFGILSAPCIAHYVRDFNAEQFKGKYPRAVEAIQQNTYMDDFIDSVDSNEEAIKLVSEVKYIHAAAGFHIRNWSSNSVAVINHVENVYSPEQPSKELADTEKVLGMYWDPNKDVFVYIFRFARLRREVFTSEIIPTKREILQVLMSIFDPLGLISCYTTTLKILLQEVWRSGIDWDSELFHSLFVKWQKWKKSIELISSVEIPRCYSPLVNEAAEVELHTFVDAGEDAYAAVCYVRVVHKDNCDVSIVAGKSKVAPLKPMSITRLELQAAAMGVKLADKVLKMQRIKYTSKHFWTDSKTVLQWLQMDPKRFQQFVMHRVGEILESTDLTQWRWVPSKLNPADLATKYQTKWDVEMWFSGPKFLYEDKSSWPASTDFGECNENELRHQILVIAKEERSTIFNLEYFSDWRRLYRAVATFKLYMGKLEARCKGFKSPEGLTFEMVQQARSALFREAQRSQFSEEIRCVKRDDEGVLRAKGRASFLNHEDVIILPTNHHVTLLLVRYVHNTFHHMSHETVINNIRSKYHIPHLRALYKSMRKSCQRCKNISAVPVMPQMSSLPPARLASFERPFTYVGIDYLGPLHVTVGRRKEKRWGVLFTCLTVRAVHLEIAHSLDNSSCIMSIRNFVARRGTPREMFTDNGTHFKSASKVIAAEVNHQTISKSFDSIKWKFNPPAAPHMGGAWERLVRSVKTTLYQICPHMTFTDETLKCALAEIEFIINSRPLTFVSLESCDDEALTPNHLLLGSSDGHKPINYQEADLRQRWHQTQSFADKFWKRWLKEYTPTLIRRGKWFEKTAPLEVGDIVIVIDENLPRHCWPKGKIINTLKAKDGQVRQATVQLQNSILQRPTAKLAKLDVGSIRR